MRLPAGKIKFNYILVLVRVSALTWVSRLLTPNQKLTRLVTSEANLARFEADPDRFVERFLTLDECWIHHFESKTKRQFVLWKHSTSPAPNKNKVVSSAGKVMASVSWDAKGIVFIDYLQKGKIINGEYYAKLLREPRQAIKSKRPGKLTKGVLLHHKTMLLLTSLWLQCPLCLIVVLNRLITLHIFLIGLFSVPKHEKTFAGKRYESDDDVISAVEDFFESQEENFYVTGIRTLQHRWKKCVDRRGVYVKK